jgi:hypothetical protein
MLSIALQVLAAWIATAVTVAFIIGALIRSAERLRIEEVLTDLFSFLARRQSTR